MPYVWVEPDKFMDKSVLGTDVDVHHVHDADGYREYHFQIRSDYSPSDWMAFDVRDLTRILGLTCATPQAAFQAVVEEWSSIPLEDIIDNEVEWYEGETE